jgi:hypothetical protein
MAANNSFANVYPQLADRLAAAVPSVAWVDLDQGQLDQDGEEYPLPYDLGVVLIDFEEVTWEDLGQGRQRGEAVIRFTLARLVTEDSYQYSSQRAAALTKLEQLGELHRALNHYAGDGFGALVRVGSSKQTVGPVGRWVYSLSYRTRLVDDTGVAAGGGTVEDLDTTPRGNQTRRPAPAAAGFIIPS